MRTARVFKFFRWTGSRKAEAVIEILKGAATIEQFCLAHGLHKSEVQDWVETFIQAGRERLGERTGRRFVNHRRIVNTRRWWVRNLRPN